MTYVKFKIFSTLVLRNLQVLRMEKNFKERIFYRSLSPPNNRMGRFIFLIALSFQTARARGGSLFQAPFPISFHSFGTKKRESEPLPPFFRDAVPPFTLRGWGKNSANCKTEKTCPQKGDEKRGYTKPNIHAPASACNTAKTIATVFRGSFPKSFAPKKPPTVTPSAVGMSTEKS